MNDTQLLECMFRFEWRVSKSGADWKVWGIGSVLMGSGPTPRRALEDAALKLEADVLMPLEEPKS